MKKFVQFTVVVSTILLFSGIGLYLFQSGRIFYKSCIYLNKGRNAPATIGLQATLYNYPFSPFASISRAILYDDFENLTDLNGGNPESTFLFEEIGSPIYTDYFVFSAIAYSLILGLLGTMQRYVGWRGCRKGSFIWRIIILSLIGAIYWVGIKVYIGFPEYINLRETLIEIDPALVSEEAFFILTNILAAWMMLVFFFNSIKYLKAFRKKRDEEKTGEPTPQE